MKSLKRKEAAFRILLLGALGDGWRRAIMNAFDLFESFLPLLFPWYSARSAGQHSASLKWMRDELHIILIGNVSDLPSTAYRGVSEYPRA